MEEIKAKNKINKFGCNCRHKTKPVPSLYHELTCPKKSNFLLSCPSDQRKENFVRHYGKSITLPNIEDINMGTDKEKLTEMMRCSCGHWFPRWKYYRCPNCQVGH